MQQARKRNQAVRKNDGNRILFSITILVIVVAAALLGANLFTPAPPEESQPVLRLSLPTAPTVSLAEKQATAAADRIPLIGVVAGHKGYDPGAVCPDGLAEADINYTIAVEVVSLLKRRGIRADLLDEYDERLADYQAEALVSIHADSCLPGATGFKVARVTDSAIPADEDRLVACLVQEYAAHTGLAQHPASITDNMTNYHAFNEINPHTPGAIIETGFLSEDRYLLQSKPKIVARGIASGLICFLGE